VGTATVKIGMRSKSDGDGDKICPHAAVYIVDKQCMS